MPSIGWNIVSKDSIETFLVLVSTSEVEDFLLSRQEEGAGIVYADQELCHGSIRVCLAHDVKCEHSSGRMVIKLLILDLEHSGLIDESGLPKHVWLLLFSIVTLWESV